MPLPTLVFFALGVGVAAALLGGHELRISPRHALLTSCFKAYALFMTLVVIPVSVYFYVCHGDWFLLYTLDVRGVPSAIALLMFVAEAVLGALGFLLGAALARAQRTGVGYIVVGICGLTAAGVLPLFRSRLSVVGTFAQYRGDFGLHPYGGPLLQAGMVMALLLAYATAYLLVRINLSSRRT
jgi:hypothetical protein